VILKYIKIILSLHDFVIAYGFVYVHQLQGRLVRYVSLFKVDASDHCELMRADAVDAVISHTAANCECIMWKFHFCTNLSYSA